MHMHFFAHLFVAHHMHMENVVHLFVAQHMHFFLCYVRAEARGAVGDGYPKQTTSNVLTSQTTVYEPSSKVARETRNICASLISTAQTAFSKAE